VSNASWPSQLAELNFQCGSLIFGQAAFHLAAECTKTAVLLMAPDEQQQQQGWNDDYEFMPELYNVYTVAVWETLPQEISSLAQS